MGSATNTGENTILDHFLGTTNFNGPIQLYVALMTGGTTSDSVTGTEVSGGGYAREAVNFGAASGGVATNSDAPTWTATGANYGTVTHINLYTASSGGTRLFWSALNASRVVNDGDTVTIEIGNLQVSLT
jgi:hypothetical protein